MRLRPSREVHLGLVPPLAFPYMLLKLIEVLEQLFNSIVTVEGLMTSGCGVYD